MSISADTGELQNLATGLQGMLGQLASIAEPVVSDGMSAAGAAGHPDVAGALRDFSHVHADNIGALHDGLAEISRRLGLDAGAAQALEEADQGIVRGFQQ